jgi:hypothetical protein
MIWEEWNANFENSVKISDISENRIFFRDNFLGANFGVALHEFEKSSAQKNWEIHPGWFFHFATKYFNNMVFLFIYMQKKHCFSNITTYLILAYKTKLINIKWKLLQ